MLGVVCGLLVGLLAGAGTVLALHFTNALAAPGQRQVAPFSQVSDAEALALAERFRPWLRFDSSERWQPLKIDSLIDEGTHGFCRGLGRTGCTTLRSIGEFDNLVIATSGLGAHLNLSGSDVSQYHGPERCRAPLLDCGTGVSSAIYYHVTQSNARFYIDYWWFLRDNHVAISRGLCFSKSLQQAGVCDEHEGDWEGVTVVTPPNDPDHVGYVVYAAHKGAFRYAPASLQFAGPSKTRPVVYVANGSHAAYPIACQHAPCFEPIALAVGGLVDIPEGRYDGGTSWARDDDNRCGLNTAGTCLISLRHQDWTNWPGQWGDGCESACGGAGDVNSPQSPGLQSRYQTPWCSTETTGITCDGRVVTCSDWLGPLVQAVICDPTELSAGLRSSKAITTPRLALVIGGQQISELSTPGVVQALGDPLRPGTRIRAVADGPGNEILLRARDRNITVEDRFANLNLGAGQEIEITISPGANGPTVRADGHGPIEQRILISAR